jgi:hypothetical protein
LPITGILGTIQHVDDYVDAITHHAKARALYAHIRSMPAWAANRGEDQFLPLSRLFQEQLTGAD